MNGVVTFLTSGLYTTIQDKGRFGFSKYGVPKSGVMDQRSFRLANALLDNDENCAVLEWMMIPPKLVFSSDTFVVFTGAICDIFLNTIAVKMNTRVFVKKDEVIEFKNVKSGCFGYVGIRGGFNSPLVMNSRSFYKGISALTTLKKGDQVFYSLDKNNTLGNSSLKVVSFWNRSNEILVYPGIEYDLLSLKEKEMLLSKEYTISHNRNRMAIHLIEDVSNNLTTMLTSPVLPGTVQLTSSGKLMILMRDCQTTGGYPRIFQLQSDTINCIAQKGTGDKIRFKLIHF